jgi:hypothetical protein
MKRFSARSNCVRAAVRSSRTRCWVGDRFAYDCAHHHPVALNRQNRLRPEKGRFCGDIRPPCSAFSVSKETCGLSGLFLAAGLCNLKFRSRRRRFDRPTGRWPRNREMRSEAWSVIILDLVRGLQTADATPRGHSASGDATASRIPFRPCECFPTECAKNSGQRLIIPEKIRRPGYGSEPVSPRIYDTELSARDRRLMVAVLRTSMSSR